jgi:hypothetical protein
MSAKSLETRVTEAMEIRKSLRQMGLEVMDELRGKLAEACNRFVRDGHPATIKYKLEKVDGGGATVVVALRVAEGTQSGVTLQQA